MKKTLNYQIINSKNNKKGLNEFYRLFTNWKTI